MEFILEVDGERALVKHDGDALPRWQSLQSIEDTALLTAWRKEQAPTKILRARPGEYLVETHAGPVWVPIDTVPANLRAAWVANPPTTTDMLFCNAFTIGQLALEADKLRGEVAALKAALALRTIQESNYGT